MEFWGPFCQWLPFPASPIFPISVAPTSQALLQPRRGPVWSRSCHRRWRSSRSWRPVAPWPRAEWAKMDAILNVDNFALWKQCWFSIAMRLPRLVSPRVPMVIFQSHSPLPIESHKPKLAMGPEVQTQANWSLKMPWQMTWLLGSQDWVRNPRRFKSFGSPFNFGHHYIYIYHHHHHYWWLSHYNPII